jgi:hypothetical protein
MMTRLRLRAILILVAIFLGLQGCADDRGLVAPTRTPGEIVEEANAFAARNDIEIEDYSISGVSFDYISRRWRIFYERKSLAIGGHFTIVMSDERAEEIELIPGR